eukprot:UN26403
MLDNVCDKTGFKKKSKILPGYGNETVSSLVLVVRNELKKQKTPVTLDNVLKQSYGRLLQCMITEISLHHDVNFKQLMQVDFEPYTDIKHLQTELGSYEQISAVVLTHDHIVSQKDWKKDVSASIYCTSKF